MKFSKRWGMVLLLLLPLSPLFAWRIENHILIIEKGDNLWQIAHALYARGYDYQRLWKGLMDTGWSKNPNIIYEDMRFNLDSLQPAAATSAGGLQPPIYLLQSKEEPDNSWWIALFTSAITILCVFLTIWRTNAVTARNQRTLTAFEMNKEFNSDEMVHNRRLADELLINLEFAEEEFDLTRLSNSALHNAQPVFAVFHFYERLSIAQHHRQVNSALIPALFGPVFLYWYDYCFSKNIAENKWSSTQRISDLYNYLIRSIPKEELVCYRESNKKAHDSKLDERRKAATHPVARSASINLPLQAVIDPESLKQHVAEIVNKELGRLQANLTIQSQSEKDAATKEAGQNNAG